MTLTTRGAAGSVPRDDESLDVGALDAAVLTVASNVDRWAATAPRVRAELLERVRVDLLAAWPAWLEAACEHKGLAPGSAEAGEELVAGVGVLARYVDQLRRTMLELATGGAPRLPGPVRHVPGGRVAVGVLPRSGLDRVLFARQRAEVWMHPGATRDDVVGGLAPAYRDPGAHRGVSLVLGAGNVASLGPRDVLHELFVAGRTVVLKANPVNEYLVEHWDRALKPLRDEGVLRIVRGGAATGAHLVRHSLVDAVHVTGSDKTYDAIVFGTGEDGRQRKSAGVRLVTKPVTAELGCVSPVIVVPGRWSRADLAYQAAHVASMLVNNAGFNCLTPRVLVTWRRWPQRGAFLNELECVLSAIRPRRAYYPGAHERHAAFLAAHPDARLLGRAGDGELPWTLVRDVDPGAHGDPACNVEAFCALMAETGLDAATPDQFVDVAVEYCNEVLWGTLSATVLAHPDELADPLVGARLAAAVAELRYGSIGLNLWHAWSYAYGTTTWGAFPGHPPTDIQSGTGVVGNALLFDRPQKSVVAGPFRSVPTPPTFPTARRSGLVQRRVVEALLEPSPRRVAALLRSAV